MRTVLRERREVLSPTDHQTHRRFGFKVPLGAVELWIEVGYSPKWVVGEEAARLAWVAVRRQAAGFGEVVGAERADEWLSEVTRRAGEVRVANLITVSIDDAAGRYRGAAHRHDEWQRLLLGEKEASAGLVAGPLGAGEWVLTLSAHTVVSDQVEVSIQIGAEMATSVPSGLRSSA